MAATRPRTTSGSQPGFMTSEVHGELFAAFLTDAADRYARDAAESGSPALAEATVRMARRAAIEIRTHHGLDDDQSEPVAFGTVRDGNTYGGES